VRSLFSSDTWRLVAFWALVSGTAHGSCNQDHERVDLQDGGDWRMSRSWHYVGEEFHEYSNSLFGVRPPYIRGLSKPVPDQSCSTRQSPIHIQN